MEADFDELLTTTVKVSTAGPSRNKYGVETWSGSGTTYNARYVERREDVRGPAGEVMAQRGIVWVDSTAQFSTAMRVKIASASSKAFPILVVERYPDEDGAHHVKLRLGM